MKRFSGVSVVVLAALFVLSGCSASGGPTSSGNQTAGSGIAGQPGGVVGAPAPAPKNGKTGEITSANRDVVTTGSMSLTVKDPISAAQDAVRITEQAGGRIDSRTENPATEKQPASANLALRIPSGALERTLAELKKLGTVNFVSLNASDVTAQTQDLDARITSLRTSVDRLLALMAQASSTTDLIAIEGVLSSRQSDLESFQSQRKYLADQVDFSTVALALSSTATVAPGAPDDFWTGILAGWNTLLAALGGALVGIGFVLPWLLALGLVAGLVTLIVWLSTRRRHPA